MIQMLPLTLADWGLALAGGGLIGLAAGGLMLMVGRIAGASGLIAGALQGRVEPLMFVIGLPLGALLVHALLGGPIPTAFASPGRLVLAGLLVGLGARLANGCTSGHAVCGIARLSPRSLVATLVFMIAGVAMVALLGRVAS